MFQTKQVFGRLTGALFAVVAVVTVSGCAVQPKSQAYKLDSALGTKETRDKDTLEEHQQESALGEHGFSIAGSGYSDFTYGSAGLSGMQFETLGMSLLLAGIDALGPPHANERTFIIGRLPVKESQTAIELHSDLFDIYDEAFTEAMNDAELEFELFEGGQETARVKRGDDVDLDQMYEFKTYLVNAPDLGCNYIEKEDAPRDSNCVAIVKAGGLERQIAPNGYTLEGQQVWAIDSSSYHYIKFAYGENAEAMVPAADLQKVISENLPEWAYMFMPDATNYIVVNAKGEAKGYPYYLNQGEEIHFVTPEKLKQ